MRGEACPVDLGGDPLLRPAVPSRWLHRGSQPSGIAYVACAVADRVPYRAADVDGAHVTGRGAVMAATRGLATSMYTKSR
ncbi:hypothetical protein ASG76_11165 [Nocardioides sp. Soil774]|nr:hypothetical protein ASG76_11165 [Nocardioides sp. Soil774]